MAVGNEALSSTSSGSQNAAVGFEAMDANSTGDFNTAVGYGALTSNTTSDANTALGWLALASNTTAANSTAVGYAALAASTGAGNVGLGAAAGYNITTGTNNVAIANLGTNADSGTIRIGTSGTHTATYVAGIHNATSASGIAVLVNSNGLLGTTTSSARFKDDIRDMGDGSNDVLKLRPVRFHYKPEIDSAGLEQWGLVAEEVARIYPDLVTYDEEGRPQAIRYHFVNAMVLNEVQRQARRIANLEEALSVQANRISALHEQLQPASDRGPVAPGGVVDALACLDSSVTHSASGS